MSNKISVVINTFSEESNISQAIKSVRWADEVIVCDMYSTDKTVQIAEKLGAKVVYHKYTGYVEPARNYAISCCSGEWILILDADEQIPASLGQLLGQIVSKELAANFVEIPRKNLIFGKWMKASMWWPDYHIRFFRKGAVTWRDEIHSKPLTVGVGMNLPAESRWAILHQNYDSVGAFIERMNRYTAIQASELSSKKVRTVWTDFITKPASEFMSRYFAERGFEDGLHGLALSLLQASSVLVVYLKLWEINKFKVLEIDFSEVKKLLRVVAAEFNYWLKYSNLPTNKFIRLIMRLRNKFN